MKASVPKAQRFRGSSLLVRPVLIVLLIISFLATVATILLRPDPRLRSSPAPFAPELLEPLADEVWSDLRSRGHRAGPVDAELELVFFTDYECGFCREPEGAISGVRSVFPEKLAVIYRHYPLRNHLPAAYEKARLAECAAEGGRFAELQPLLYEIDVSDPATARSLAEAGGIDDFEFLECAADTAPLAGIEEDLALIREIGTRRTSRAEYRWASAALFDVGGGSQVKGAVGGKPGGPAHLDRKPALHRIDLT